MGAHGGRLHITPAARSPRQKFRQCCRTTALCAGNIWQRMEFATATTPLPACQTDAQPFKPHVASRYLPNDAACGSASGLQEKVQLFAVGRGLALPLDFRPNLLGQLRLMPLQLM